MLLGARELAAEKADNQLEAAREHRESVDRLRLRQEANATSASGRVAHVDDPVPVVLALADVDDGLRLPGSLRRLPAQRGVCAVVSCRLFNGPLLSTL